MDDKMVKLIRSMFDGVIDDNWIETENEVVEFLRETFMIDESEAYQMIEKALRSDLPSWRV